MNNDANREPYFNSAPRPLTGEQAAVESQLKGLQPAVPPIDFERLDLLLASREEVSDPLASLPISPSPAQTGRSWGALATAWSCGVAVGVIAMLLIRAPQVQQFVALHDKPTNQLSIVESSPNVSIAEAGRDDGDPSSEENPSSEEFKETLPVAVATAQQRDRAARDKSVWQAMLLSQELRAGTHIYTTTPLVLPVPENRLEYDDQASLRRGETSHLDARAVEPRIPTPRAPLDGLWNDRDGLL